MKSVYYVGSSSGSKKNKPDEKWYAINVLRENSFGSICVTPLFVRTEEKWRQLVESAPDIGTAVHVERDLDNEPERIIIVSDTAPLLFDKKK